MGGLDDLFNDSPGILPTAPWGDWFGDFIMRVNFSDSLSVAEQYIAGRLGADLYKAGFDSNEAFKQARKRAVKASDSDKFAAGVNRETAYMISREDYMRRRSSKG